MVRVCEGLCLTPLPPPGTWTSSVLLGEHRSSVEPWVTCQGLRQDPAGFAAHPTEDPGGPLHGISNLSSRHSCAPGAPLPTSGGSDFQTLPPGCPASQMGCGPCPDPWP